MTEEIAEELFRQVAAFASFGFAKIHAAAFARTAYESSFLKLFYPAQFLVGLINAQPMGFYPVEVLVNDAKRHGVAVLPVDINASSYRTTTEWVGPARASRCPPGAGIDRPAGADPLAGLRRPVGRGARALDAGGHRGLGRPAGAPPRQGDRRAARRRCWTRELARGPYASLADVVERTGLPEEVLERLIRTGALDSLGRPRRELLWQLREVAGASRGRVDGRALRGLGGRPGSGRRRPGGRWTCGCPATEAPGAPRRSPSRSGSATPTRSSGSTRGARS